MAPANIQGIARPNDFTQPGGGRSLVSMSMAAQESRWPMNLLPTFHSLPGESDSIHTRDGRSTEDASDIGIGDATRTN